MPGESPWNLLWASLLSVLVHGMALGFVALVDHLDWSLRADISWEVDGAKLRQVGLGPMTMKTTTPPEQTPPDQREKKTTESNDLDKVPDTEAIKKALAGELDVQPEPVPAKTPRKKPSKATPPEKSKPEPESHKPDSQNESPDKRKEGSESDREFADKALRREGPADLPRLNRFAPGNARYTALLRFDRLRGQTYEESLVRLFRALPDYRLLAASTELNPIEDLDTIFFASGRPQYLQYTFIAIRHNLSEARVRRAVDSRYPDPPAWQTTNGLPTRRLLPRNAALRDSRRIVLADTGLTLVARPEWLSRISSAFGPVGSPPDTAGNRNDRAEPGSLVAGLRHVERVADKNETIALVSAYGLTKFSLPGAGRIRGFQGLRGEIARPTRPTLTIDFHFENANYARKFTTNFPGIRQATLDAIPLGGFLDLDKYVARLEATRHENFVQVRAEYSPREIERLTAILQQFIPRPPVLEELPSPNVATQQAPDAGSTE